MSDKPIDMILHCPDCGVQHIDVPDAPRYESFHYTEDETGWRTAIIPPPPVTPPWTNPPHRSHLCGACGTIWRPADVPTNGVRCIVTRGHADTWPPS